MSELLFVNACVRGARSRTLALARHFLTEYEKSHPGDRVTERNLMEERLEPQYPEVLAERDTLWNAGRLEEPMFAPARHRRSILGPLLSRHPENLPGAHLCDQPHLRL